MNTNLWLCEEATRHTGNNQDLKAALLHLLVLLSLHIQSFIVVAHDGVFCPVLVVQLCLQTLFFARFHICT